MPLSDREKLINHIAVIETFGKYEGHPREELFALIEMFRKERCRKVSREETQEILNELKDESLAAHIMINELASHQQ